MRSRASAVLSSDAVNKAAAAAAAAENLSRSQQSSPLTSPGVSPRSDGEGDSTPRRTRRSVVFSAQEAGAAWLTPAGGSTGTTPGVSPLISKRLSPRHDSAGERQPMSPHAFNKNTVGVAEAASRPLVNHPTSPTQQQAHVRPVPSNASVSPRALQQGSPRALRSNSTTLSPRPLNGSSSTIPKLQGRPPALKTSPRGGSSLTASAGAVDTSHVFGATVGASRGVSSLTASAGAVDTSHVIGATVGASRGVSPRQAESAVDGAGAKPGRYDNTTVRRTLKKPLASAADGSNDETFHHSSIDLLSELEGEYAESDEFLVRSFALCSCFVSTDSSRACK